MNTTSEKRASITIVGLQQNYKKEDIIKMLVLQNGFIKGFSNSNDINQHIEIYSVRPLKKNPERFQVFASVSSTLREGMLHFGDKVSLGFTSCRIFDRVNVKRCFNCQKFGHYMKECPTPDATVCGKCASNDHITRDCSSFDTECINCVREGLTDFAHYTNSIECPVLVRQQNILKRRLNMQNRHRVPLG